MKNGIIINSEKCKEAIREQAVAGLHEAAREVLKQAVMNTPVDTGNLKQSWDCFVDEGELKATIGNPNEYAIYVEFGTGQYALEGNGRKGGWTYVDEQGKGHFTKGMRPVRPLGNAFRTKKGTVKRILEKRMNEIK